MEIAIIHQDLVLLTIIAICQFGGIQTLLCKKAGTIALGSQKSWILNQTGLPGVTCPYWLFERNWIADHVWLNVNYSWIFYINLPLWVDNVCKNLLLLSVNLVVILKIHTVLFGTFNLSLHLPILLFKLWCLLNFGMILIYVIEYQLSGLLYSFSSTIFGRQHPLFIHTSRSDIHSVHVL